ncbi:hypothetical protein ACE1ET_07515 [Saccharicrinis sp. FJH62]|uniref:hypothetical protein n=1 Tax=Saccharicrinis sp. FJH62 TaxID=3344657 RepID=UPI0035D43B2A
MKPYLANLINSIVLIALGLWSYFGSETPSVTALIPVFVGVVLLAMVKPMQGGNRVVAHIVVTLTFLLLVSLVKPLTGAIGRDSQIGVIRVVIMMATSLYAMIIFIKSFVDARVKK